MDGLNTFKNTFKKSDQSRNSNTKTVYYTPMSQTPNTKTVYYTPMSQTPRNNSAKQKLNSLVFRSNTNVNTKNAATRTPKKTRTPKQKSQQTPTSPKHRSGRMTPKKAKTPIAALPFSNSVALRHVSKPQRQTNGSSQSQLGPLTPRTHNTRTPKTPKQNAVRKVLRKKAPEFEQVMERQRKIANGNNQ